MQDCAAGLQQAAEGAEATSNLSPPQPEHNPDASLWTADLDTSDSDVEESVSFDDLILGSELPPPTYQWHRVSTPHHRCAPTQHTFSDNYFWHRSPHRAGRPVEAGELSTRVDRENLAEPAGPT
jgi:hypothetical protein